MAQERSHKRSLCPNHNGTTIIIPLKQSSQCSNFYRFSYTFHSIRCHCTISALDFHRFLGPDATFRIRTVILFPAHPHRCGEPYVRADLPPVLGHLLTVRPLPPAVTNKWDPTLFPSGLSAIRCPPASCFWYGNTVFFGYRSKTIKSDILQILPWRYTDNSDMSKRHE